MAAIGKADQRLLAELSQLALCNPFTPARLKLEKAVLGNRFQPCLLYTSPSPRD